VISEEWTGKDVEGIGHITISNNTIVTTFTAQRTGRKLIDIINPIY